MISFVYEHMMSLLLLFAFFLFILVILSLPSYCVLEVNVKIVDEVRQQGNIRMVSGWRIKLTMTNLLIFFCICYLMYDTRNSYKRN